MKLKLPLLCCTFALLVTNHLPGYALLGDNWTKNRTVVMHLSLPNQKFSSGLTFNQCAEDALNIWNQYLDHLQFAVVRNSPIDPVYGDGDNSVFVDSTIYGKDFGPSTLAVTTRLSDERHIKFEADVIFKDISFDDYRGPARNGNPVIYDFHRIALHEFGHVLGLDHPDQDHPAVGYVAPSSPPAAIMTSTIGDVDALQRDDIEGAQSLYANGPAYLSGVASSNLVNLSTRAFVAPGDNALIGGFIVQGSHPATVVLRAIGHSLRAQGVASPLTDPVIEIHAADGRTVATNDDWISDANAETIASYRIDPSNSRESALIATLDPGSYTAVVHAFDGGDGDLSGTALFELYDLHTGSSTGRAANLSTRGQIISGDDVLIGGFIVGGTQAKPVAARAIGPSLSSAGVANAVTDPTLELRDVSGNLVSFNNDWRESSDATALQSEGLAPTDAHESALQATLAPGNYTAIVRSNNNAAGVGLVELYDLSPAPQ